MRARTRYKLKKILTSRLFGAACLVVLVSSFGFGPLKVLIVEWQSGYKYESKVQIGEIKQGEVGVTPRVAMAQDGEDVVAVPSKNTIQIPSIGVDTEILEGKSIAMLNKGIWRRPQSPELGKGNFVLAGHRYMWKTGPNTFYKLPELKNGDLVRIFWKGERKDYFVKEVFEVAENATDIEKDTGDDFLTLYTCTLITSSARVVVRAYPK